uniref:Uncharacterized protein n=1 Tax=Rhizophora mucronata TaxID=61149 RepID=A0A2P2NNL4_RHIMU
MKLLLWIQKMICWLQLLRYNWDLPLATRCSSGG